MGGCVMMKVLYYTLDSSNFYEILIIFSQAMNFLIEIYLSYDMNLLIK